MLGCTSAFRLSTQHSALSTQHSAPSTQHQIQQGLEQSIAHSRGQLTLKTTTLPLPPPPARRVARLHRKLNMSQSVFAATLNVSPKLVQSWEQGARTPRSGDLRLFQLLVRDPRLVETILRSPAPRKSRRSGAVA